MSDLQGFLGEQEWGQARMIIENIRDLGYDPEPFQAEYNKTWFVHNILNTPGITFRSV